MKRNVGGLDRAIRLLVGVFLMVLGLGAIRGKGGVIVAIVGLILLMTGLKAFARSTCRWVSTPADKEPDA